eukprot:1182946-Prorocentrum_minimum.AAC.2
MMWLLRATVWMLRAMMWMLRAMMWSGRCASSSRREGPRGGGWRGIAETGASFCSRRNLPGPRGTCGSLGFYPLTAAGA